MSLVPNTREAKASGSLNSRTDRSATEDIEKLVSNNKHKQESLFTFV